MWWHIALCLCACVCLNLEVNISCAITWQVTEVSLLLSEAPIKKIAQKRFYVEKGCLCKAQTKFVLCSAPSFTLPPLFFSDDILLGLIEMTTMTVGREGRRQWRPQGQWGSILWDMKMWPAVIMSAPEALIPDSHFEATYKPLAKPFDLELFVYGEKNSGCLIGWESLFDSLFMYLSQSYSPSSLCWFIK